MSSNLDALGRKGSAPRLSGGDQAIVKNQVKALLNSHESALDAISQGVLIADRNRRTTYVNAAFVAMTGYTLGEVRGRRCSMLQGPDTDPATVQRMKCALTAGEPFHGEVLNYRKDGSTFWNELSIVPVRDKRGRVTHFVGVQRDITVVRQTLRELTLASQVFQQSNEALAIADVDGQFLAVNRAFSRITGYAQHEVLGRTPRILKSGLHDEAFYVQFWKQLLAVGHWEGEIWNRRKDGTIYPEWLSVGRVVDDGGTTTNYVASFRDITERKQAEENVRRLAYYDALTGLPNRILLQDRVHQAMEIAMRGGRPMALMFLDVDHFKNVNDTLGHSVGDRLLLGLSSRMQPVLRQQDTLARVGGDEFVLVLPGTDATGAAHVAEKLLTLAEEPFHVDGRELTITPSIGIAVFPTDAEDYDSLLAFADAAMYRAKTSGRARFSFYTAEMQAQMARTLQLENDLRRALERGEMSLHYQPQYRIEDGCIVGAEALLRWNHPELGWVSPAEFVPLAESSGQIEAIGAWVLAQALRQQHEWKRAGLLELTIAVNVSAVQLRQPDLALTVAAALEEEKADPRLVELELTETVAWNDPGGAAKAIARLRDLGLGIAIDDFGVGYTSFTHLTQFGASTLKIDRSIVAGAERRAEDRAIVAAVVKLGRTLGMRTVAEGVETAAQLECLREAGCDAAQGWLLGRAVPAADFEALLR